VSRFDHIITLEEHNVSGGFGSAVLEYVSDLNASARVHRFGIPDLFIDQVHSPEDARIKAGLTLNDITNSLLQRGVL
jgi:transketolase